MFLMLLFGALLIFLEGIPIASLRQHRTYKMDYVFYMGKDSGKLSGFDKPRGAINFSHRINK
jgi:hypothetical protein